MNCDGEFAKHCAALIAAGYSLRDSEDGQRHVEFGAARVVFPAA